MGMYTELHLFVKLDKNLDKEFVRWFELNNQDEVSTTKMPDENIVPSALKRYFCNSLYDDSYYFDAIPTVLFKYDDISKSYFLTIIFNIKNYENEIELFISVLSKYIISDGYIGHIMYEEDDAPILLFIEKGKIIKQRVERNH
jgi:hypothetical protein